MVHPAELRRRTPQLLHHFEGLGEVYSFTTIYDPPARFEHQAPYTIALVRCENSLIQLAQLTDLGDEAPYIGMKVESVTRVLRKDGLEGLIVYGYKFRPLVNTFAVRE